VMRTFIFTYPNLTPPFPPKPRLPFLFSFAGIFLVGPHRLDGIRH
jgi:hypothetical protein